MRDFASATPHMSMREHVAQALRNAIINGELVPGETITEAQVAAQLGTSRAPVREAIAHLVTEGFLETEAYRETRVAGITAEELHDVLVPIRIVTETFAVRHLMNGTDLSILDDLDARVAAMQRALVVGDYRRIIDEDLAFHRLLVRSVPFTHPARIWSSITPVIYRAFVAGTTNETARDTVDGHVRLLALMRAGKVEAAVNYLTEHIHEMEVGYPKAPASNDPTNDTAH